MQLPASAGRRSYAAEISRIPKESRISLAAGDQTDDNISDAVRRNETKRNETTRSDATFRRLDSIVDGSTLLRRVLHRRRGLSCRSTGAHSYIPATSSETRRDPAIYRSIRGCSREIRSGDIAQRHANKTRVPLRVRRDKCNNRARSPARNLFRVDFPLFRDLADSPPWIHVPIHPRINGEANVQRYDTRTEPRAG